MWQSRDRGLSVVMRYGDLFSLRICSHIVVRDTEVVHWLSDMLPVWLWGLHA